MFLNFCELQLVLNSVDGKPYDHKPCLVTIYITAFCMINLTTIYK